MPASKKSKIEKICKYCKEIFLSNNIRKIYCSPNCRSNFHRISNPQKHNEEARAYYKTLTKERRRHRSLMDNYGISLVEYNIMAKNQDYKCQICQINQKLHVDHDHGTGVVRGLLCNGCNRGLGFFSENTESLIMAAKYLQNAKK